LLQLKPISRKDVYIISSIILIDDINTQNTVLDPKLTENGGIINLPSEYIFHNNWNRQIKCIYIPKIETKLEFNSSKIKVAVLHPILFRANIILKIIEDLNNKNATSQNLQTAINQYFLELSNTLFGKNGLFNRAILGPRLNKSFRAVIIPGKYPMLDSYEFVGIPKQIMNKLNISEGDKVIIGRDPTIWFGSIELFKAYQVDHNAIELHPSVLTQFGGDYDGDQVWGFYPDQDSVKDLICGEMIKSTATWTKGLNTNKSTNIIDFNNFFEEEEDRIKPTGLSISPSDVYGSPEADEILRYLSLGKRSKGKVEILELQSIANGLTMDEWSDINEMINRANVAMKVYMGPIGSLSLKLLMIGSQNPELLISSNYLAERISQSILDSKHLTLEQIKKYKPSILSNILNMKIKFNSLNEFIQAIKDICNCDDNSNDILAYIYNSNKGINKLCSTKFPLFEGITFTAENSYNGYMPNCIFEQEELKDENIVSYAYLRALEGERS
jgi:hypothetical protein